MEAKWVAVTAVAPVAWGSNYFVTHEFLPADHPLYGALLRALPAGLLLLAVKRKLPTGSWWWRSLVLGTLNVGAFFVLIYVAAQRLPTSVASTVMATSPVVMMLFAWLVVAEPPRARQLTGAGLGIAGVVLMVGVSAADLAGVLASIGAMVMSSLGYVLAKKWSDGVDILSLTAWQLIAGALVLLPVAALAESPPPVDGKAALGFAYVTVVATALAFVAWFAGLRHLDAGTVGLVGLLNPVTGVLLGTAVAAEALTGRQLAGLGLVLAGILVPHAMNTLRSKRLTRSRRRAPSSTRSAPRHALTELISAPRHNGAWGEPDAISGPGSDAGLARRRLGDHPRRAAARRARRAAHTGRSGGQCGPARRRAVG